MSQRTQIGSRRVSTRLNTNRHFVSALQKNVGNLVTLDLLDQIAIQPKLRLGAPGDKHEREADRVADQVVGMAEPSTDLPASRIQRKCAACEDEQMQRTTIEDEELQRQPSEEEEELQRQPAEEEDEEELLQSKPAAAAPPAVSPQTQTQIRGLQGRGRPLPPAARAFYEPRFGHDFSNVRIHHDSAAHEAARSINARAFTLGCDIAFASGQYEPQTQHGRRLMAHELAHVVQQGAAGMTADSSLTNAPTAIQRQIEPMATDPMDDPRMHPPGAPKAKSCTPPSWCPAHFCQPYSSQSYALHQRTKMLPVLMLGIAAAVDSAVVPLWHEHLLGGSAPKDLSSKFGSEFTNSKTTKKTTDFLAGELKKSLEATPPTFPPTNTAFVDISTRIGAAIGKIDDPSAVEQMNFNIPGEVPGNLAGGIGKDQTTCPAGAQPSPFADQRKAAGTAIVTRDSSGNMAVSLTINYTVKDTIDLCPGDCGTSLEQIATVPISQFEATGISGDVPFTVEFPSPPVAFTIATNPQPTGAPPKSSP